MGRPRIIYVPRSDATQDDEIAALTAIYRFILFESEAVRKAASTPSTSSDGTMEAFRISKKEKGGKDVEAPTDRSSGVIH